jgi:hypothetical protein
VRTKTFLLHSVSAIATVAASNGQAFAQVLTPPAGGYSYQVGGGLLFSPAERSLAGLEEDKMGSGFDTDLDDFDKHLGGNAFFSVGKQIDNTWDVRLGGSINKLLDSTGSLSFSSFDAGSGFDGSSFSAFTSGFSGFVGGRDSFRFATIDFEVGYTPVLTENMSVRLFAGIRGLAFAADSETTRSESSFFDEFEITLGGPSFFSSSFSGTSTETMTSRFLGLGPRVGLSAAHRFEGTNFGVSGTVAGAALFGHQTTTWSEFSSYSSYNTFDGSSSGSFSSSYTYSTHKLVLDVEAKGGIDFYLTDDSALTIGYRAEVLTNVGPWNDMEEKKLVHGPFISLTGSLPP